MNTQATVPTYALLVDGATVEVRQAGPDDLDAVRGMHEAMSVDNMYLRFFNVSRRAPAQEARRVCRAPGPDHVALLAMLDGEVVGVAGYEPTAEAGVAEIAFAVADPMHGRGVATLLLEHLVSIARSRHVRAFTALTLPQNTAMLHVFADAGLNAHPRLADGVVDLTIPLPPTDATGEFESYLDTVAERERHADVASLRHLIEPESIAVVGAGRRSNSVGRAILHNIISGGFSGQVFAVNPHARHIGGVPCLPSIASLPEPVDLAVVAVPAAAVLDVAAECGRRGVRSLVVITSGLSMSAGADLLATCRRHGMRLVGPNCFGVATPGRGLDATFAAHHPCPGQAGLVVQSGGVGIALLDHLSRVGVGVSSFASVGDKYDVSSNDMLLWWESDPATRLAVLYVESFGNPRKFARTARRVGRRMPVLTVHAGRSAAGQRAAASHTAAAATPLLTREALFEQAGIIATRNLGELVEAAVMLACQPVPAGPRVAVVSNAGGAGVLAADACVDARLVVAGLGEQTQRRLRQLLPAGAVVTGPVDTTAGVTAAPFRHCLEVIAADEAVDAVLALVVPTATADLIPAICGARVSKPIAASVLSQPEAVRSLTRPQDVGGAVPAYAYPETAVRALARAIRYGEWRARPRGCTPAFDGLRVAEGRKLIQTFLRREPDGGWLAPGDVAELLGCFGVDLVASRTARDEETAVRMAGELGGRVVLKADVPGLVHKTDAGAVHLDLRGEQDVRTAFQRFTERFGGRLAQVLVQPMITGGVEVIVGVVQEPVFGPLVVFGLGGVATEVLGDHVARLAPLTDTDADDLIHEVRAAPLLLGHRGSAAADITALRQVLLRISRLAEDIPEVAELDLNPVIARPDGVFAVDARIRVAPCSHHDPFLRRLR